MWDYGAVYFYFTISYLQSIKKLERRTTRRESKRDEQTRLITWKTMIKLMFVNGKFTMKFHLKDETQRWWVNCDVLRLWLYYMNLQVVNHGTSYRARRNSPQPNDTLNGATRKRLLEWWREKSENSFHSSSMHEHKLSYAFFPLLFCLTLASASCLHQLIIYVPSRERRSARDETRYPAQVLSTRCVCVSSVSDHHCTAAALRIAIMIIAVLECFAASPSHQEMKWKILRYVSWMLILCATLLLEH